MTAAGLVAAAGASDRMGFPKALLAQPGHPPWAMQWALTMKQAGLTVWVSLPPLEHHPLLSALARDLRALGAAAVPNAWPQRGLLGSVQTVLAEADSAALGLMMTPVDVPPPHARLLKDILAAAAASSRAFVQPTCQQQPGHPLWVPSCAFAQVRALETGSIRTVMEAHPCVHVPWSDVAICTNVNTVADAARVDANLRLWRS